MKDEIRRPITFPTITRKQAEELEKLRRDYGISALLYELSTRQDEIFSIDLVKLDDEKIAIALLAGYDVEWTVEEQIANSHHRAADLPPLMAAYYRRGMLAAWNILRNNESYPYNEAETVELAPEPDKEL